MGRLGRPLKQTVDYFPHICNSSKTIPILESQYGNDGYAFWFKLLELLSKSAGHFYDCNNPSLWQFLLAKTRVNEDTANNIILMLVNLGKIDRDLWDVKVIWCQGLVDNLYKVYVRREAELPQKPIYSKQKHIVSRVPVIQKPRSTDISRNKKRQSIVKYSIVKDNKAEKGITDRKMSNPSIYKIYEDEIGKITPMVAERLKDLEGHYPATNIVDAIKEAVRSNARNFRYIEKILENWKREGKKLSRGKTMEHPSRYKE